MLYKDTKIISIFAPDKHVLPYNTIMNRYFLSIAFAVMSLLSHASEQTQDSITCFISGVVIDRPDSKAAILIEAGKDFRVHEYATSSIVDGKYSFILRDDSPRVYQIVFDDELNQGGWINRYFYTGNGKVQLTSYDDDHYKNDKVESDIQDNLIARKFSDMEDELYGEDKRCLLAKIDSLYDNNAAYTPDLQHLREKYQEMPQGQERDSMRLVIQEYYSGPKEKRYNATYLGYDEQLRKVYCGIDSLKREFIRENPSLFGLFSISHNLQYRKSSDWIDIPDYINIFNTIYKDYMPDHQYTDEIIEMIKSMDIIAGNEYPDFKVTRPDGTSEMIASLIKGNAAVIDLWASWCGPCRRHSIELIPLYEKYKDKGFKVIAVAREKNDCNAMYKAMKQDGYPWESFVDLNDKDHVWEINNAGNSGGKIILVDSDGVIVGTDISTKEIEEFLVKTYGE